jgi:hypothetical protein
VQRLSSFQPHKIPQIDAILEEFLNAAKFVLSFEESAERGLNCFLYERRLFFDDVRSLRNLRFQRTGNAFLTIVKPLDKRQSRRRILQSPQQSAMKTVVAPYFRTRIYKMTAQFERQ